MPTTLLEVWYAPDAIKAIRRNRPNRPITVSTKVRVFRGGLTTVGGPPPTGGLGFGSLGTSPLGA